MVKKKKGFTIVELVIVIAVIAILAAVLIPTFATIINKANQSADIQLVRNLNSAIVDGIYVENELDTAENIRDHLAKNGYGLEDLVTKNSDNVLALNKTTKKVEAINLDDFGASDNTPYYDNEVVDGYIIFSVIGNSTAEGFFDLRNFPSNTDSASVSTHAKAIATIANDPYLTTLENHVTSALNKIDNKFRSAVADVMNKTIYVIGEDMYVFNVVGSEVEAIKVGDGWDIRAQFLEDDTELNGFRPYVVFNSDVKEFNVDPLMVPRSGLYVVIPNHVNVTGTKQENSEDLPTFAGNISSNIIPKNKIKSINAVKELVEQFSDVKLIEYGQDQVYTSDCRNNLATAVKLAEELIATKTEVGDSDPAARIVVNSNVTVSGNITIPNGITVEIPFGIGNYVARDIMRNEYGNMLGGKALGEAYPANDSENLTKAEDDMLYYLCGEGPGGGYDLAYGDSNQEIFAADKNISANKNDDFSLTISSGSLTINGILRIGAVVGYPNSTGYQGHTSGAYAEVINNGKIIVENGGVLDVFGFIKGSGEVVANDGGLVYEPFVVTDYLDGFTTLWLYPFLNVSLGEAISLLNSPFMRYTVMNIQTKCTINYGSALYARANLMVFDILYCRADAPAVTSEGYYFDPYDGTYKMETDLIKSGYVLTEITNYRNEKEYKYVKYENGELGYDDEGNPVYKGGSPIAGNNYGYAYVTAVSNGALVLSKDASVVNEYEPDKVVDISKVTKNSYKTEDESYELDDIVNKASLAGDIGVNKITINGNVTTDGIEINLLGTLTERLEDNAQTVNTSKCILPIPYFFNFVVENGAHLTIDNNNRYALMPGAELTVKENGKLTIKEGSALYALDAYDNSEFFRLIGDIMESFEDLDVPGYNEETGLFEIMDDEMAMLIKGIFLDIMSSVFNPEDGYENYPFSVTIARKYYPTATLLKANGFEASAKLTINGKLYVESGAGIGGIVNATKTTAEIELEEGAILGELWNGLVYLGGPYDTASIFYQIVASGLGDAAAALSVMTFTTQQCFFRLIGPDGEMDLSDYYKSEGKVPLKTLICNAFGINEEAFEQMCAIDPTLTNAYGEDGLDVSRETNGHYTFKLNSTSEYILPEANTVYVVPGVVANNMGLRFKASTIRVNTKCYGGNWSIETIEDGATD